MPSGTVKKWVDDKEFGFIRPSDGSEDVFVHSQNLSDAVFLSKGEEVEYEVAWDARRDKYTASSCTRRAAMNKCIDIPASAYGLIIGPDGATLKRLQEAHNVKITIPRGNALGGVVVAGDEERCLACEGALKEIVSRHNRTPKPGAPKSKSKAAEGPIYPETCEWCGNAINSVVQAFDHLAGYLHWVKVDEAGKDAGDEADEMDDAGKDAGDEADETRASSLKLSIADVVQRLGRDDARQLHLELGFAVDEIIAAAPAEIERRAAKDALDSEVAAVEADPQWFKVEWRRVARWDDTARGSSLSLLQAPTMDDMLQRITLDATPRLIRLPRDFPVPLPRADPGRKKVSKLKADHRYPGDPSSRLACAIAQKLGLEVDSYSIMCGTSLIRSLAGDTKYCKEHFFLQRFGKTALALHVPGSRYGQDDTGGACERLLCGSSGGGSFAAATSVMIDGIRCLVVSEVDASDDRGQLVELKSSKKKRGTELVDSDVVLQTTINGSVNVLACHVDAEERLQEVQWLSADEARAMHEPSFVAKGQRVRLLLRRVLDMLASEVDKGESRGSVWKLSFDSIKAPVLAPAEPEVEVLPVGLV